MSPSIGAHVLLGTIGSDLRDLDVDMCNECGVIVK